MTASAAAATEPARMPGVVRWIELGECERRAGANGDDESLAAGSCVAVCTYRRPAGLRRFLDSLALQTPRPAQLVIVDASPDTATEQVLLDHPEAGSLAGCIVYARVSGALVGLTRQRNFALRCVRTELVAFFDDDIVLLPGCLARLEATHRVLGEGTVGVGACIANGRRRPPLLWRLRRLLLIVSTLRPGRYCRTGMSTPWGFLPPTDEVVPGDWLQGGATCWKSRVAREVGFNERLPGYGHGEDLEFSLRLARRGALVMDGRAQVLHLHESAGRPDEFQTGYSVVRNHHEIHRTCLRDRGALDELRFLYAFGADALLRSANLLRPDGVRRYGPLLRGRWRALADIVRDGGR